MDLSVGLEGGIMHKWLCSPQPNNLFLACRFLGELLWKEREYTAVFDIYFVLSILSFCDQVFHIDRPLINMLIHWSTSSLELRHKGKSQHVSAFQPV